MGGGISRGTYRGRKLRKVNIRRYLAEAKAVNRPKDPEKTGAVPGGKLVKEERGCRGKGGD